MCGAPLKEAEQLRKRSPGDRSVNDEFDFNRDRMSDGSKVKFRERGRER